MTILRHKISKKKRLEKLFFTNYRLVRTKLSISIAVFGGLPSDNKEAIPIQRAQILTGKQPKTKSNIMTGKTCHMS